MTTTTTTTTTMPRLPSAKEVERYETSFPRFSRSLVSQDARECDNGDDDSDANDDNDDNDVDDSKVGSTSRREGDTQGLDQQCISNSEESPPLRGKFDLPSRYMRYRIFDKKKFAFRRREPMRK
uniref:Uncharacterized protein n=1 Tax=Vespula pensylvanica TaxID=30213 RepID=A0A834P847_VESPE|nr:hypothetical protein H0235_004766 [Vespula pensylvanica]